MAKVPLTSEGVQTKQEELFALSQEKLDDEAMALIEDFRGWINKHFELTSQEQEFLENADEEFLRLLSSVVIVSVRNRISVDFARSPVERAVKRFVTRGQFDFGYTWGESLTKDTLLLDLEIIYE